VNRLQVIEECGQSIWLDAISRTLIESGQLQQMIQDDGLRGVTSNPSIFEKAITHGDDYDAQLRELLHADPGRSDQSLYEALAIADIRMAADVLRPVYDASEGADGYVSLEISPHLAHETPGSVAEAQRLWRAVDRPNLMIKIPASPAGIAAIEETVAAGINVNVTLIFSLAHYEAAAGAYLRGIARAAQPRNIASVASLFVSRLDSAVDPLLERVGAPPALALRGRIAVANAKLAYRRFRELFFGASFAGLRQAGARVQRLLWGSTGTKNPNYSDVLYVEHLIGRDTVNTVPPETLDAFRDHGVARVTVGTELEQAEADMARLREFGIDLGPVFDELQRDGLASFALSYDRLLGKLHEKRHQFAPMAAQR